MNFYPPPKGYFYGFKPQPRKYIYIYIYIYIYLLNLILNGPFHVPTLESGIDVRQGINVGPGKFVKKYNHRALNKRRA